MLSFQGRHYPQAIILLVVRWYVAYSLSYRQVEELAKERGLGIDHATIQRWVIRYAPALLATFKQRKARIHHSWRVDETYLKVKGEDVYLYRAVDKLGNTIDFMLSKKRDKAAALRFLQQAIATHGLPEKVTVDKSGANLAALMQLNVWLALVFMFTGTFYQIEICQCKYLNNIIEQDHRHIKRITKPMLGFKSFLAAKATLAGIELHHMLRKGQYAQAANLPIFDQFYALAA